MNKITSDLNLSNAELKNHVHRRMHPKVRFSDRPLVIRLAENRQIPPPPPREVSTSEDSHDTDQSVDQEIDTTSADSTPHRVKDRIKRAKTKVATEVPPTKMKKSIPTQMAPIPASPVAPVMIQRKKTPSPKSPHSMSLFNPGILSFITE